MSSVKSAQEFLSTLNGCDKSLHFTMEIVYDNKLPCLGMVIEKVGTKLESSVYRKPKNTG